MAQTLRSRLVDLARELHRSIRGLRRDPIFTVTALLILALACGAHTAMLTAVRGLLLAPLPYAAPERLVSVFELRAAVGEGEAARRGVALDTLDTWREIRSFEHLAGYRLRSFGLQYALGSAGTPPKEEGTPLSEVEVVQVGMSTAGLFRTLAVEPVVGRAFDADEERAGAPMVVIGHVLWQRVFAADPGAIGRRLWLNGVPHTLIGVLPPSFRMVIRDRVPDAYIPISHADYGGGHGKRALEVVARLAPGVQLDRARIELDALGTSLAEAWPETHRGHGIGLESLDTAWRGANRRPLALLLVGASLLLLIACVNVAGLMLVRSLSRRRQRAIRAALGADGLRLALPPLAEGAIIGLAGGLLGLWVAQIALDALPMALPVLGGAAPVESFDLSSLHLDLGSAAMAGGLALVCGLVLGAWPAWRLRRRPPASDLGAARSPGLELGRGRAAVVVAQVALGTLLLLAGGLLGRSFLALLATDPGFEPTGVTSFGLGLPEARYDTEPSLIDFHQRLHSELSDLPGVEAVGAVVRRPLGRGFSASFEHEGSPVPGTERPRAAINLASDGYFEVLRIPLLDGRLPDWKDAADSPRVLVINEAFRRAHFGADAEVLGRRLLLSWWSELTPRGTPWEIVGIVGDVRQQGLDTPTRPEIYLPFGQYPTEGATYLVRSRNGEPVPAEILDSVVAGIDPELQKVSTARAAEWAANSLADRRLALLLVAVLGLAALFTTAIGVYAMVATDVTSRRSEMAVRLALGARVDQISRLVVARGLKLVSLGFLLGTLLFLLLAPGLRHLLHGVGPADPLTLVAIWLLLALTTWLASAGPAARAKGVSVVDLLRD